MRKSQVGALSGIQRLRLTYYIVWMEDSYGVSGIARVFSSLLSLGMVNLVYTTYSKCISCGKIKEL